MKKLSITIFVPALNEGRNIGNLLLSLLEQNHNYYVLQNILVVSDGSTDDTEENVKKVKSKKVKLISYKSRKGKMYRCNQVFSTFAGDVLVQIDADTRITDIDLIDKLIKPFRDDRNTKIVCGYHVALRPRTLVEKIANFGNNAWNRALNIAGNPERYYCIGQLRAFSKSFANNFRWPNSTAATSEDVYMFYFAKVHNIKIVFVKDALVYFRLPNTLSDYSKQMRRFLSSRSSMETEFGDAIVKKYDVITSAHKAQAFFVQFAMDPFIGFLYMIVQIYTKKTSGHYSNQQSWEMINSTKNL